MNKFKKIILTGIAASVLPMNMIQTLAEDGQENPQTEEAPPEKPDGEMSDEGGTPPDMPEGEMQSGETPPDMPDGEGQQGNPPDENPGGGFGGADTMTYDYSGELSGVLSSDGEDEDIDSQTIESSQTDQNVILNTDSSSFTVTNSTLNKSGDDTNDDNSNFYGVNSIVLTTGENTLTRISGSTLSASSSGSNAVFATNNGTIYANEDAISTTADNSRGLDATYGGTVIANNMTVSTEGDHSASIATDRGGGTISVTNSTLTTSGSGSPLLYSTGNVQVDNVTGTASGSQIAGMEGLNTILIYNSDLTSEMTGKTASDPVANGVIIYQSTSGDAESSTGEAASFQVYHSTLTSAITSGSMFYVTNTTADIVISESTLNFDTGNVNLLLVEGNDANSWGTPGENGAVVNFTALNQELSGNITVDSISDVNVYLLSGSIYKGASEITVNDAAAAAAGNNLTMNISSDSKWIVSDNSYVTNLYIEEGGSIVDENGNSVTIIDSEGNILLQGDSDITVTVSGEYGTSFETGEYNTLTEDYIDRTDFDAVYNLSTAFNTNTADTDSTADTAEETADNNSSVLLYGSVAAAVLAAAAVIFFAKKKN